MGEGWGDTVMVRVSQSAICLCRLHGIDERLFKKARDSVSHDIEYQHHSPRKGVSNRPLEIGRAVLKEWYLLRTILQVSTKKKIC